MTVFFVLVCFWSCFPVKRLEKDKIRVKSEIWYSLDRREDDLINQETRTIRALDELDLFSIDDDEAEPFEGSAEMSFSQIPELNNVDSSQILDECDFPSIPIFPPAAFQK